ncbi:MAG: phosphatidylglycerol lysyltransferase domain-containing protein [Fibrobacter sp.]|nr:phosphatidylglycerol lysyltransferase domain-containing protein [Fibrobacter sp.]
MLNFKSPELSDRDAVNKVVDEASYVGSDASFGNIYLLRKKYGTLIAFENGAMFRYYNGKGSRRGYAFPLSGALKASDVSHSDVNEKTISDENRAVIFESLRLIERHAVQNNCPLEFCLVTEEQGKILKQYFGDRAIFEENRGDSDYIYSTESLATLEGNDYRKKRNHFSRFNRTYSDYELRPITAENSAEALDVEKLWLIESGAIELATVPCESTADSCEGSAQRNPANENVADKCGDAATAECCEDRKSRCAEFDAIAEALYRMDSLGFRGAILYVNGIPAGMTMATEISSGVWDIHFEKVIGEYAKNGGYTAINKLFAESLGGVGLINREEDINIEGLRKAKLSYYPLVILHKYHVTIKSL